MFVFFVDSDSGQQAGRNSDEMYPPLYTMYKTQWNQASPRLWRQQVIIQILKDFRLWSCVINFYIRDSNRRIFILDIYHWPVGWSIKWNILD